jgi:hypothetical protein
MYVKEPKQTNRDVINRFDDFMMRNSRQGLEEVHSATEIKKLEDIFSFVRKEGKCIVWTGTKAFNGLPICKFRHAEKYVHLLVHGKPGRGRWLTNTCGNKLCLEHWKEIDHPGHHVSYTEDV